MILGINGLFTEVSLLFNSSFSFEFIDEHLFVDFTEVNLADFYNQFISNNLYLKDHCKVYDDLLVVSLSSFIKGTAVNYYLFIEQGGISLYVN